MIGYKNALSLGITGVYGEYVTDVKIKPHHHTGHTITAETDSPYAKCSITVHSKSIQNGVNQFFMGDDLKLQIAVKSCDGQLTTSIKNTDIGMNCMIGAMIADGGWEIDMSRVSNMSDSDKVGLVYPGVMDAAIRKFLISRPDFGSPAGTTLFLGNFVTHMGTLEEDGGIYHILSLKFDSSNASDNDKSYEERTKDWNHGRRIIVIGDKLSFGERCVSYHNLPVGMTQKCCDYYDQTTSVFK